MNRTHRLILKGLSILFLCVVVKATDAQTVVRSMSLSDNYGAGTSQYIWNAFSGAGDVTNSYEFLPRDYNGADASKKYPIIFYFPGVGDVKTSDPNSVLRLGLRALPLEIEGGRFQQGFPFIVVGLQGSASSPASEYAAFMENYIFTKYANKIDFNRIYLTGLSMGGGRIMEYMADATRAAKIAAITPVATGTGCPFTKGCTPASVYNGIINNIVANQSIGVFFTHNLQDPTVTVNISRDYVIDVNAQKPGKAKYYFDPNNPNHDAWSDAYSAVTFNFEGKNMYDWLAQFSLGSTVLPVVLSNFSASRTAAGVVSLKWETATESQSRQFSIERSADGARFSEIGKVDAAGNSTVRKAYAFTDDHPAEGTAYYRLKLVDTDGSFTYSPVRKLLGRLASLEVKAGPNPVSNYLNVSISGQQQGQFTLTLTDLAGRSLHSFQVRKNAELLEQRIDLSGYATGTYTLRLTGAGTDQVLKIVKR